MDKDKTVSPSSLSLFGENRCVKELRIITEVDPETFPFPLYGSYMFRREELYVPALTGMSYDRVELLYGTPFAYFIRWFKKYSGYDLLRQPPPGVPPKLDSECIRYTDVFLIEFLVKKAPNGNIAISLITRGMPSKPLLLCCDPFQSLSSAEKSTAKCYFRSVVFYRGITSSLSFAERRKFYLRNF